MDILAGLTIIMLVVGWVWMADKYPVRLPQQTDYSDYREVDGVKVPFRWTVAQPRGQSTVQVTEVQQNVPITDSKFSIPAGYGPSAE